MEFLWRCSRIGNVQYQDIRCPNPLQIVHDGCNITLLNHRADGHPPGVLQSRDCRRTLSRGDLAGRGELLARDVVLAKHIFLCGCPKSISPVWKKEGENILITPRIRDVIKSTSSLLEFFDLTNTAVLSTTVSIGFRPAAFIVSPDSIHVSMSPRASRLGMVTHQRGRQCHPQRPMHRRPRRCHRHT